MPSFEPSYYRTKLKQLEEEKENTSYAKSHFEENWENLRVRWNDNAGRNVNTRNMSPLCEGYGQLLKFGQQYLEVKNTSASRFESLQRLLIDSAHHHEYFNQVMAEMSIQAEERERGLRSSTNLTLQVEEQQQNISAQINAANRHVTPLEG